MKSIFFFLFLAFNLAAMKAPNCYFAHQKFLAMISSCEQRTGWFGLEAIEQRQQCVNKLFEKFRTECSEEESAQKETSK